MDALDLVPVADGRLEIVPVTFRAACAFVAEHHRHNRPPRGMKFCLGLARGDDLIGVAVCGRPSARALDDGRTIEVTRTCTLGDRNANSMLYGAAWRTAKGMGYLRSITYTRKDESGASLRAAGYVIDAELPARPGWADSSVKLRALRDAVGDGGVDRLRWRIGKPTVVLRFEPMEVAR